MSGPLLAASAAIWLVVLFPFTSRLLRRLDLMRANYQGEKIPVGFGIVIVLWSVPLLLILGGSGSQKTGYMAVAALSAGFGLLGLIDDLYGDRSVGGFRGHVRALFRERRVTTGLVKLGAGALLSFLVPLTILKHPVGSALLEGALIALSANALNLLDVRPGRAGAVFLALGITLAALAWKEIDPPALVFTLIPAAAVYVLDARARVMLGDTGSNVLGAVLGCAFVLLPACTTGLIGATTALVLFHLVAERWSITGIIEKVPVLRFLDSLTGRR